MGNGDSDGRRGDVQRAVKRLASLDQQIASYRGDGAGLSDLRWQATVESQKIRFDACSS